MSGYMDASGSAYVGEHTCRRLLTGDAEDVRERLVYALERLDYAVLSEQPIQAKRGQRKGAVSADFLDYARRLNVALRPQGETATLVTFDFSVAHSGLMTKGDRRTLEREADAVVALAAARQEASLCPSCGTENTADSRFCRLCGAPAASGEVGEVELARLTAGARASLQEIFGGLLLVLLIAAVFLPLVLFGGAKAAKAGWFFLALGQLAGWWMLLYGVARLHRTLNPKAERHDVLPAAAPAKLSGARTNVLPPAPARVSVTEGTTELLGAQPRERVPARARRRDADTGEMPNL
ncbi:MAG TPA: zinc ribbon domain-containing protein [Pyrinomonadaceae bacterium]|nr:zinc ribbon domain-containing protein [Pyrinomonadaceae bacterium]